MNVYVFLTLACQGSVVLRFPDIDCRIQHMYNSSYPYACRYVQIDGQLCEYMPTI